MRKMKVLFVAGLMRNQPEVVGGQLTAAITLMDSGLREHVDFLPVDSTKVVVPTSPVVRRVGTAASRLFRYARLLPQADVALIFTADGLSLVEKSIMCAIARWSGRGAVLRPSSGGILEQSRNNPLMHWVLRQGLRHANSVCGQSKFWVDFFRTFPEAKDKVYEVPNPVAVPDRVVRRRPPGRPPRLLFCGSITRNKGVFECLEVLRKVRPSFPDCELVFAGHGNEMRALAAAAESAGLRPSVSLKGPTPREEVFALLRESDIFLFPSHYEGMPNAVLEAMSCGVPVVATRVGGLTDLIHHGVNGFAFEVGDIDGLAGAVTELLSSPHRAEEVGKQGWQTVLEKHNVEQVWRIFARLLCRAAYEAGRRPTILCEPAKESTMQFVQAAGD